MFKSMITCCLFFLFTLIAHAQERKIEAGGYELKLSAADPEEEKEFCQVGINPQFPGGERKMVRFAKQHLYYPRSAINDNVQGSVTLEFEIDKKGRVTKKKVFQGVRADLDRVCLRMLNQMPRWQPGSIYGKPIVVRFSWKIIFMLTE